MEAAIDEFTAAISSGSLAFFYYSGHGLQVNYTNYLLPVDFAAASEIDVKYKAYPATRVQEKMEASGARLRVLVLDACRNNPFRFKRDALGGLASMPVNAEGTLIAFATGDGNTADDNQAEANGLYTKYLIPALQTPGLALREAFQKAKEDVFVASKKAQNPSIYENIVGAYYLVSAPAAAVRVDAAAETWALIKDSTSPEDFESFAQTYPASDLAGGARIRAAQLRRASVAAAPRVEAPHLPSVTQAGTAKVNPVDGQRYLWIPPGGFMMGCSPGDGECFDEEKPAHEVTVTKGFWMGQTAVTVGAWKRYAQATGKAMPPTELGLWKTLNAAAGDDTLPVVGVTWDEAAGYCGWAGMRLPTEAEWEWAARAGTTGARYVNLDEIAWYADNSGRQRIDSTAIWNTDQKNYVQRLFDNGNGPRPVGQKLPNAYGLYDMLGNVWQWTADWYGEKYYQAGEKQDPSGPPGGQFRALRGGSWGSSPRNVRVSFRNRFVPGVRVFYVGLRCVGE